MMRLFPQLAKLIQLVGDPTYRRGLRHGVAAAIEHLPALRNLDVQSILDVGANKGQFSLVARNLFPNARILAFEPLSEPASVYYRLFSQDSSVLLHEIALGSGTSTADIHISGRKDSSSLLPILPRQDELYPGTAEVGTRTIRVMRGDDVVNLHHLDKPLLIKLDIQGYEKEALAGLPLTLNTATYIYTEVSFQELYANQVLASELITFLQNRGFALKALYNLSSDSKGQPVYADALFQRA